MIFLIVGKSGYFSLTLFYQVKKYIYKIHIYFSVLIGLSFFNLAYFSFCGSFYFLLILTSVFVEIPLATLEGHWNLLSYSHNKLRTLMFLTISTQLLCENVLSIKAVILMRNDQFIKCFKFCHVSISYNR